MLSESKNGGPFQRCSSTLGGKIQGIILGRKNWGRYSS